MTNMTFNTQFHARYHYVAAMRINPDVEIAAGGFLSPHDVSHAAIAGWLLGQGFTDFKVVGDERPFGIQFLDSKMNPHTAEPGDWLLVVDSGSVVKLTHDEFTRLYTEVPQEVQA